MSVEIANGGDDQRDNNETELRELVYQSLEHDGLITRLKAQLRAAVFKTIEKASNPSDIPSTPAQEGTTERVCRALVLDWLEHSNFLYTHDLLKVETSGSNRSEPLTQTELLDQLHLESPSNKSQSILQLLVNAKPTQVRDRGNEYPLWLSSRFSQRKLLIFLTQSSNQLIRIFPLKKSMI